MIYKNQIIGILSMGHPDLPDAPDIYTRVYSYLIWIRMVCNHITIDDPTKPPKIYERI